MFEFQTMSIEDENHALRPAKATASRPSKAALPILRQRFADHDPVLGVGFDVAADREVAHDARHHLTGAADAVRDFLMRLPSVRSSTYD